MAKRNNEVGVNHPFFGLVRDVSSLLVSARSKEIEKALDDCLAKLGEYFDVQQVALGQISSSGELLPSLRMWGDVPAIDFLTVDPPGPEMVAYFIRNGSLTWNCLEDLDGLPQWREHCRQVGAVAGSMWLHSDFGSHVEGLALSRSSPKVWPKDTVECLGVVGQVLFNAFYRQTADNALEQAFAEIEALKEKLVVENETLRQEVEVLHADDELIGKSHVFRTAIFQAEQVAPTDSTVLLLGETGTGKGLMARRIHERSRRSQRPLITVNCAALPSSLIESELFGHEKGAFTGAVTKKIGRFELADGGTIFLDEVGDLPTELQAKLLRVLQDQEFERLGSSTTQTTDARVIAATNRDLDRLIEQGEFRADLYYRLGVFPIRAPALRERRADIPLLVWFFISELQHRLGREFDEVSAQAMDALTAYDWPGNVRELKNIVERAMILSQGSVLQLGDWFSSQQEVKVVSFQPHERAGETIEEVERAHIEKVLAECDWKIRGKGGAAEHLGLKRTTLQSRMKKLGIERPTI
jgi:transcriptional regulator with GAF, ATPase, and Fis domain